MIYGLSGHIGIVNDRGGTQIIEVELIVKPSINATTGVSAVITLEPCWMDPIIDFLAEDQVSDDDKEASRVR